MLISLDVHDSTSEDTRGVDEVIEDNKKLRLQLAQVNTYGTQ